MNLNFPLCFGSISSLFRRLFVLICGVPLCLSTTRSSAQRVTFAGAQATLPFVALSGPYGAAVDGAGDVFIVESGNNTVVELPRTATGYGTQKTLPFSGLDAPTFIALDAGGDVFLADTGNNRVVELPQTSSGYGPQTTLPTNGLIRPYGIAVDSAGDVFIADAGNDRAVELPKAGTGYGTQATLASGLSHPWGVSLDSAGDLFVAQALEGYEEPPGSVFELPRTGTGYGPPTTLPFSGLSIPIGVAVDNAGDVFVTDYGNQRVEELPKASTNYGSQIIVPTVGLSQPHGVAVDSSGNIIVADSFTGLVLEVHRPTPVNFGSAYVCMHGQTDPAPCSHALTLIYNVTASGTLGTPEVLTSGTPDLDFTRAGGGTCIGAVTEGSSCMVNVSFAPEAVGTRNGMVEIIESSGTVLAATPIYGAGIEPPPVAQVSTTYLDFGTIPAGDSEVLSLSIKNIGGGTLTIAPVITGHSMPPPSAYPYVISTVNLF